MVRAVPVWARIAGIIFVVIIAFFMLFPLLVVAGASLSTNQFLAFPPEGITLRWYAEVFSTNDYVEAAWTSLWTALVVTVLSLLLGTPAAIAISRFQFPGVSILSGIFLSPIVIPSILLGIGLLTYFSIIADGPSISALITGHVIITIPYIIRTVAGVLEGTDRYTEEAARTMGARWYERYWYIILPMARRGMIAGAFFAFNISFDDAVIALFLRTPSLETLPLRIYSELEFSPDPSVAAVSTMMVLLTVLLVLVIERSLGIDKVVS